MKIRINICFKGKELSAFLNGYKKAAKEHFHFLRYLEPKTLKELASTYVAQESFEDKGMAQYMLDLAGDKNIGQVFRHGDYTSDHCKTGGMAV